MLAGGGGGAGRAGAVDYVYRYDISGALRVPAMFCRMFDCPSLVIPDLREH